MKDKREKEKRREEEKKRRQKGRRADTEEEKREKGRRREGQKPLATLNPVVCMGVWDTHTSAFSGES